MTARRPETCSVPWLIVGWAFRLLVAGLFCYTGVTKVLDLNTFVKEVRAYQLVPVLWSNSLAYVLPWMELLAAAALLTGVWRREGRLLLVAMLVVFTVAKAYVLAIGRTIDCGCVPTASAIRFLFDGWVGVATNVVLVLMLGVEAYAERLRRGLRHPHPPGGEPQALPALQDVSGPAGAGD